MSDVPNYLKNYADRYAEDPRAAALQWFREARYGLFLHYGLYSLVGRHEWVQLRELIPVAEYAKLMHDFTAEHFDAERIAQFAVDCEMKYINITTRHHDSFCLFETAETDFNSVNAPAGRDLIKELAAACDRRGLGLCLYYSHGRDWKHPHAPTTTNGAGKQGPNTTRPNRAMPRARHTIANLSRFYAGANHRTALELRACGGHLAGRNRRSQQRGQIEISVSRTLRLHPQPATPSANFLQAGPVGHGRFSSTRTPRSERDHQAHGNLHDHVFRARGQRRVMGLSRRRRASQKRGRGLADIGDREEKRLQFVVEYRPSAGWIAR